MVTRVLVPVDQLECTYAALESMTTRNWHDEPEFMLLKVVEDFGQFVHSPETFHMDVLAQEQSEYAFEVREWLTRLEAEFKKYFPNTIARLECGNVVEKITEVAYEWSADHIVIGSHDLDVTTRCALGSIAAKVILSAPCTVEIVRFKRLRDLMKAEGRVNQQDLIDIAKPPRKILVATDLSSASEAGVDWVAQIEWPTMSAIRVLTIVPPEHKEPGSRLFGGIGTVYTKARRYQDTAERQLIEYATTMASTIDMAKVETEIVVSDQVAEEIARYAEEWNADLIVMGARGKTGGAYTRVGPTVIGVLEKVHCSVVIVQNDARKQVKYSWRKPFHSQ